jgi:hypothetical protein
MRISQKAADAFMNGKAGRVSDNTVITIDGTVVQMRLFENLIALKLSDRILVSNGGYMVMSNTTKDRLNALPGVSVVVRGKKAYLNGEIWDGSWASINRDGSTSLFNEK